MSQRMNVLPLPHGPSEPLACPWWHGSLHETVHDFAQVLSFAKVCVELAFPWASMRARILRTLSNVCLEKRTMLKVRIATRFRSRIANTQIMLVRKGHLPSTCGWCGFPCACFVPVPPFVPYDVNAMASTNVVPGHHLSTPLHFCWCLPSTHVAFGCVHRGIPPPS